MLAAVNRAVGAGVGARDDATSAAYATRTVRR
jgi:hypothetical protein